MTLRTIVSGAVAAGVACAGSKLVSAKPSAFASWKRSSFKGSDVSLTGGLNVALGIGAGLCASGAGVGSAIAVASGAAAGAIDDHFEDSFPAKAKGLKGHLGALKKGKLSSGALKIAVIGVGAAVSAATIPASGGRLKRCATWVGRTGLIAGTANLVNLLDLRPGRAMKASAVPAAASLAWSAPVGAAVLGATAVAAPDDLKGKTMLGDLGANALGAAVGYGLASGPAVVRWCALGDVIALTLLSEKYSFSRVIDDTPALAWVDQLGRR